MKPKIITTEPAPLLTLWGLALMSLQGEKFRFKPSPPNSAKHFVGNVTLRKYCAENGLGYDSALKRISRGTPVSEAIRPLKSESISAACRAAGVCIATVMYRMKKRGMTLEEAITAPITNVIEGSVKNEAKKAGLSASAVYHRMKAGMTLAEALAVPAKQRKKPR